MPSFTRSNVYALGLPPEVFARPPRLIEGVTPGVGVISIRSHGLNEDQPVTLALLSVVSLGGAPAALPGGLSLATQYYAHQTTSSDLLMLKEASGGAPIGSFSDAGSGTFGVLVDSGYYLDQIIIQADNIVDQYTTAQRPGFTAPMRPYVGSILAARMYVHAHGAFSKEYAASLESPNGFVESLLQEMFHLWIAGGEFSGAQDVPSAQPPVIGAASFRLKSRGILWGHEGGRV